MDDRRFDSLVKALAGGASRRSLLKGMLGLGGAAALGGSLLEGPAEAARRPTPTPARPKCPGAQIWNGSACVCPAGLSRCNPGSGPACCNDKAVAPGSPTYSECCDNACCNGVCYGEELCCQTNRRAGGLPATHKLCDRTCVDVTVAGNCCDDGDCGNPCQVCNHDRHICVDRCNAQSQVCCTGQAGPGVCMTGNCCDDRGCPPIDACTTNTCRSNHCVTARIDCDDHNACTVDSCDPSLGCIHTPVICDDHNACTIDSCNPETGCVYTTVDCDDGNVCTYDSCDRELGCIHTKVDCDDNNACTLDTCDPQRGCVYTEVDCDDGDLCTNDSCDHELGCIHTPIDCSKLSDPKLCLVGVCIEGKCSAESICEGGDVCCEGKCAATCGCGDCSGLNDPKGCLVGVCAGEKCEAQSSCETGVPCCEDGTCSENCGCSPDGSSCGAGSECCEACCVSQTLTADDLAKVCADAGVAPASLGTCANLILDLKYLGTCQSAPITLPGFPANPVTLPCG